MQRKVMKCEAQDVLSLFQVELWDKSIPYSRLGQNTWVLANSRLSGNNWKLQVTTGAKQRPTFVCTDSGKGRAYHLWPQAWRPQKTIMTT